MFSKTLAAAVIAGTFAAVAPAQAGHYHHHGHGGAAALGGFMAGAIVGGALAAPRRDCYLTKRRVWVGHRYAWRRVEVCE